jgi:hypothetical protein
LRVDFRAAVEISGAIGPLICNVPAPRSFAPSGTPVESQRYADLPVEQASKYQLVVNLKTAKALGLAISEAFLLRADKVIE